MSESELVHVRPGALLHDIGKWVSLTGYCSNPGALSNEEWDIMKRHPVYAYEMLSPINFLKPAIDIPYCHHEKWDGSGYPRGLKGENIPWQPVSLPCLMCGMPYALTGRIALLSLKKRRLNTSAPLRAFNLTLRL